MRIPEPIRPVIRLAAAVMVVAALSGGESPVLAGQQNCRPAEGQLSHWYACLNGPNTPTEGEYCDDDEETCQTCILGFVEEVKCDFGPYRIDGAEECENTSFDCDPDGFPD